MKAISLWQPWASLIGRGKSIETRSWQTSYRGPIAIHAAKHWTFRQRDVLCSPAVRGRLLDVCAYLAPLNMTDEERTAETARLWGKRGDAYLPFGAVVAIANVIDVCRAEEVVVRPLNTGLLNSYDEDGDIWCDPEDYHFGDFAEGRFGWLLRNIRILAKPVPFKGAQGFFDVPDELLSTHQ